MGKDICPKFIFYFDLLKFRGFEQYYGLITIVDYITGYTYKGGENSVIWGDGMKSMLYDYVDEGNNNRKLKSLVATITNNVTKKWSISRSKCMLTLRGGKLKRSSFGFTIPFSVNEIIISTIGKISLLSIHLEMEQWMA